MNQCQDKPVAVVLLRWQQLEVERLEVELQEEVVHQEEVVLQVEAVLLVEEALQALQPLQPHQDPCLP
jgi:hypothetical protein